MITALFPIHTPVALVNLTRGFIYIYKTARTFNQERKKEEGVSDFKSEFTQKGKTVTQVFKDNYLQRLASEALEAK